MELREAQELEEDGGGSSLSLSRSLFLSLTKQRMRREGRGGLNREKRVELRKRGEDRGR